MVDIEIVVQVRYSGAKLAKFFDPSTDLGYVTRLLYADLDAFKIPRPRAEDVQRATFGAEVSWRTQSQSQLHQKLFHGVNSASTIDAKSERQIRSINTFFMKIRNVGTLAFDASPRVTQPNEALATISNSMPPPPSSAPASASNGTSSLKPGAFSQSLQNLNMAIKAKPNGKVKETQFVARSVFKEVEKEAKKNSSSLEKLNGGQDEGECSSESESDKKDETDVSPRRGRAQRNDNDTSTEDESDSPRSKTRRRRRRLSLSPPPSHYSPSKHRTPYTELLARVSDLEGELKRERQLRRTAESALERSENELERERKRRRIAERTMEDVEREKKHPFIVPALFDALLMVSEVSTKAVA